MTDRLSAGTALLAPFGVAAYLGFDSGGFFAGATGLAAVVLIAVLLIRLVVGEEPIAGAGAPLVVAAVALAALGALTLISYGWSDSPARSLLEFDLVLVYLSAILLTGLLLRSRTRVVGAVWAALAVIAAVAIAGLLTRVLPETFPIDPTYELARLSFPLTYWNGLGILAGLGVILAFAIASDQGHRTAARSLAAALAVPLSATLFFTFSRGAIVATVLGLIAFGLAARPRLLPTALLAIVPMAAIALVECYRADALASDAFAGAEGVEQGRRVAVVLLLCTLAAGGLRLALGAADRRLSAVRLPRRPAPAVLIAGGAGVLVLLVLVGFATRAPEKISDQADDFLGIAKPADANDARARLTEIGSNRGDHWELAVDAWRDRPLFGQGAGTYPILWARDRPNSVEVQNAHSLYLEVVAELGAVGVALLAVAVGALFVGAALRCRGPDRVLAGGVFGVIAAWAVHAGIDWDWELPAITLIPFALAGAVVASDRARLKAPSRWTRLAIGIGLLVLILTPLAAMVSQSRLDASVRALRAGDCTASIDSAIGSAEALGVRPEPFELLAYCNARAGEFELAKRMAREAIERDPRNWEFHYVLAIVTAAGGDDPRAAAARALELNPLEALVVQLSERVDTRDPERWRTVGETAPLLVERD